VLTVVLEYKSVDSRIRIYCCSIFEFKTEAEGSVDAVWDRGALVAMNFEDRERYVQSLLPLMNSTTRYMVDTFQYDKSQYTGPPHPVMEIDMKNLYGKRCDLKILKKTDCTDEYKAKGYSVTSLFKTIYLIVLK